MRFHHRIRTIYWKELVDILRDRRTLIAMILVPIVLYPLLMLGSIQAVSYQAESMEQEDLVIGVVGKRQGYLLRSLIDQDAQMLQREQSPGEAALEGTPEPAPLDEVAKINAYPSLASLKAAVSNRRVQIGVVFESDRVTYRAGTINEVTFYPDKENVRSTFAQDRLTELFQRIELRTLAARKARLGLPASFDKVFNVEVTDLSTPSSILGQILPLILILMTITGAIYPAIDLTAGERERGTLESLMVSPVPVIDLIVGKFLVVTTVAIMGATLNLASVSATVYFGGFDKVIASAGGSIPVGTMIFILLCLIPFAVLMSAIMIAVCSYARTFKEAQNYVTPVILAVLIPGGIAALPATRMEGPMLVMPVGNMVLLARELLLGVHIPLWQVGMVLLSTSLYAAAAVALAANIFGQESVVFADAGSFKAALSRRLIKPATLPTISMSLFFVAVLFPAWFFIQAGLSPGPDENAVFMLYSTGVLMPLLFVIAPLLVLLYWKVSVTDALALRMPTARHLLAGMLIGASAWIGAHELNMVQAQLFGIPKSVMESTRVLAESLAAMPVPSVFLLIALVPAVCEEWLFRGFLLSGLRSSTRKWTAIIVSAVIFGIFHFFVFKFAATAVLGIVLGYMCWQSRSLLPGILAHFMHNAIAALSVVNPNWSRWIGINVDVESQEAVHLPAHVLLIGGVMFAAGIAILARTSRARAPRAAAIVADA